MPRSVQAHTSSILPFIALPLPSTETLLTSSLLAICTGLQLKGEAKSGNGLQKTQVTLCWPSWSPSYRSLPAPSPLHSIRHTIVSLLCSNTGSSFQQPA